MKRIHFISGLVLSFFVALHLFNHLGACLGADFHKQTMDTLRLIYRNQIVEILLLAAVIVQIISGFSLLTKLRKTKMEGFKKLQIFSGLYLAFFFIVHVSAVLSGRFIFKIDTNVDFAVGGLQSFPGILFFLPYYFLSIFSFFCHVGSIHAEKAKVVVLGVSVKQQAKIVIFLGLLISFFIMYHMLFTI